MDARTNKDRTGFPVDVPLVRALLGEDRLRKLSQSEIVSAMWTVVREHDPDGVAEKYIIEDGGTKFLVVAQMLDWDPKRLLRETVWALFQRFQMHDEIEAGKVARRTLASKTVLH